MHNNSKIKDLLLAFFLIISLWQSLLFVIYTIYTVLNLNEDSIITVKFKMITLFLTTLSTIIYFNPNNKL